MTCVVHRRHPLRAPEPRGADYAASLPSVKPAEVPRNRLVGAGRNFTAHGTRTRPKPLDTRSRFWPQEVLFPAQRLFLGRSRPTSTQFLACQGASDHENEPKDRPASARDASHPSEVMEESRRQQGAEMAHRRGATRSPMRFARHSGSGSPSGTRRKAESGDLIAVTALELKSPASGRMRRSGPELLALLTPNGWAASALTPTSRPSDRADRPWRRTGDLARPCGPT